MRKFLASVLIALAGLTSAALAADASLGRSSSYESSLGEASCARVAVRSDVEISAGELYLSDLLEPEVSATFAQAASRIHLGKAPLGGSARVLEGAEIRQRLDQVQDEIDKEPCRAWNVPERITVRRAGNRISCKELIGRIESLLSLPVSPTSDEATCGSARRIPENAILDLVRTSWNPALSSWDIRARCLHAADCVPFLVRLHSDEKKLQLTPSRRREISEAHNAEDRSPMPRVGSISTPGPVVRAGQSLTLIWDQNGIRVSVPALCLDPGAPGQHVRARIISGGTVMNAVVVSAESLRVIS
jgi:hypothetical protein